MGRYRDRGVRETISGKPDEDAEVITHPKWQVSEIEPYDPAQHGPYEPAEMYSQDSLDALERAGFEPQEPGVWKREVTDEAGKPLGASHILMYEPGHRRPSDGSRAPWHLMTDPETAGFAFGTLRGSRGALSAADADVADARRIPKQARLYFSVVAAFVGKTAAGPSAGRRDAEDWLARNTDESFEHDPREEARRWMDEHAHEYDEWHPEQEHAQRGVNYSDFMDPAGQTFNEEGEGQSYVMPGSHYDWNDPESEWHHPGTFDEPEEENNDEYNLEQHGFNWQRRGDPRRTPPGEYEAGEYVREEHDPGGNHIATHTIHWNPASQRWNLETEPTDTPGFSSHSSAHGTVAHAIDEYRHNTQEDMLPQRGYERPGEDPGYWTRSDPGGYQHEIYLPDEGGFTGRTTGPRVHTGPSAHAPRNEQTYNSNDLAEIVREQERLGRGQHPGGDQDYRLTRDELLSDPSVARLGRPTTMSDNFWGDNKVGHATWHIPHTHAPHGVYAEAIYNWDKGGYDFRYASDGIALAPTHNYVPEGAPVHVPGRRLSLDLDSFR